MAATPKNGTLLFRGKSGRLYTISAYVSDVANASVLLSPSNKAVSTSANAWRCPEPVSLEDFAMTTGTADTTTLILQQDYADVAGTLLPYTAFLDSLNNRPRLNVAFPAGALIGAKQLA